VAKEKDLEAGALDADKAGLLSTLLAEENEFDRRALFRIGTWGASAVGAVVLAVTANQWSLEMRRDQFAAADIARQAQQIQQLAKDGQNETRRLGFAIDTLNGDRDRLFSRVTVLEQGLDSVTGAIARQNAAAALPKPSPSASAMPAMTPPQTIAADPPPAAPASSQAAAPAATATAVALAPEKPKTEMAKPDMAFAAVASLPQIAANKPAVPLPPTQASPSPSTPSPLGSAKSMMGPPDPAAPKLVEPAKNTNANPMPSGTPAAAPAPEATVLALDVKDKSKDRSKENEKQNEKQNDRQNDKQKDQEKPVLDADAAATIQRTEFAVELGGANSIGGLRALWRGLLKSNNPELAELRPIMVLRESNTGLGMQLRLAAGPLHDAAEAARICAALVESQRSCETTVYDGQRLAMSAEEPQAAPTIKPQPAGRSQSYRRYSPKHSRKDEAPAPPPPKESSTFSSLFGGSKR
jgi:hypothetical protein